MTKSLPQAARRGAVATMASAADWYAKITANVEDLYAGRIDHDDFGRRNRALWDAIAADGKQDAVSRLISREQKAAGLFTRGASLSARVTRNGVRARVLRRYALDGAAWLLVETAPGIKVSWPESETRPVAVASLAQLPGGRPLRGARALQMARPSDFKAGDRVVDEHGLQGTVVGPGAGGTRVIIQWDDGSSSNLDAKDLDAWGVAAPTLHARNPQAMAQRRPATIGDAETFRDFRALHMPFDQVQAAVARGGKLEIEESGFKDAGRDYTALYLDGRAIGRMEGYSRGPRAPRTMAAGSWLKAGDRIELLDMPDDPNPVPAGTKGTVEWVSDVDLGSPRDRFTQVGVRWENGRSLMLSIPPDRVRKI